MANKTKLSQEECEKLAGEVFDLVIEPSIVREWQPAVSQRRADKYYKLGIYPSPAIMLINQQVVYPAGIVVDHRYRAIDREYAEAVRKLERKEMVPFLAAFFARENYTHQNADELMGGLPSALWGQILQEISGFIFQSKKGRTAKIELGDYKKIAALAEELVPVFEKLLAQRENKTKHSTKEILQYLKADHSKASDFLLAHLESLESALSNRKFLTRRKTLRGKSKLLAYGIAGVEFGLTLTSSAAIAAQGKRNRA